MCKWAYGLIFWRHKCVKITDRNADMPNAKKFWSYSVGKKGQNRVTVRERGDTGTLCLEWVEGGKRIRKTFREIVGCHVTDRAVAVRAAEHFSQRMASGQKRAVTDTMMALPRRRGEHDAIQELLDMPDSALLAHRLPTEALCGVYFLLSGDGVVYVGQSTDVMSRMARHRARPPVAFDSAAFQPVGRDQLDDVEEHFIVRFKPVGNRKIPAYAVSA